MIKNLIFDFGNVICRFSSRELASYFVSEEDLPVFHHAIVRDWRMLDRGDFSYDAYVAHCKELLPERLFSAVDAFFAEWYRKMPYVAGMPEFVAAAKKAGYRLFILSNAPACFTELIRWYLLTPYFDGILISGAVKDEKPNLSIYETALSRFGAEAEESVFLDDRQENVEAACRLGIHACVFDGDLEKTKREFLRPLGIEV